MVGAVSAGAPGLTNANVTVLSVEDDAKFPFDTSSSATSGPIETIAVPLLVIPLTATLYVVPSLGAVSVTVAVVAPDVPPNVTSPVSKPVTGFEYTTVKLAGERPVGSSCPSASLIVTVGFYRSIVT